MIIEGSVQSTLRDFRQFAFSVYLCVLLQFSKFGSLSISIQRPFFTFEMMLKDKNSMDTKRADQIQQKFEVKTNKTQYFFTYTLYNKNNNCNQPKIVLTNDFLHKIFDSMIHKERNSNVVGIQGEYHSRLSPVMSSCCYILLLFTDGEFVMLHDSVFVTRMLLARISLTPSIYLFCVCTVNYLFGVFFSLRNTN